ncbi:MAG: phosphate/phosphite/phosphonate ABC transporter substrate-binding protein [Phycisphaerae bacterium]|nr:phosphate/phosphite/phosphonate ABC transporter substrate-binding protein [Phycisphaerae bacterium]
MKTVWAIVAAEVGILILAGIGWLILSQPAKKGLGPAPATAPSVTAPPLRIGLIPERDIFIQRPRYQALADYLAAKLRRPVELVTMNSYQAVLDDMSPERTSVDAAFVGSLVAVIAKDRLGAYAVIGLVTEKGPAEYRGVIIVPENSPIQTVDDALAPDRSVALVRMTTAGHLFPIMLMANRGKKAGDAAGPRIAWVGTHDQVAEEVAAGRVSAGAIKDLRLDAWEREHGVKFRRLAVSPAVPDNVLWVRSGLAGSLVARLADTLLTMDADPAGRDVLKAFGVVRFARRECVDYRPVFEMVQKLGPAWKQMGIAGRAPWCECAGTTRPDDTTRPDEE